MTRKSKLKEAIRALTDDLHAAIADTIVSCPHQTYSLIATEYGVSEATVLLAASKHGITRPTGPKPKLNPQSTSKGGENNAN